MSNRNITLIGWILFVISAISFCIASIGNFWAMFGSFFFFIACIVFLIPYFRDADPADAPTSRADQDDN